MFWSRSVWPDLAIYCTLGNHSKPLATINLSKSLTFLGNFSKGVKIIHFLVINFRATFIDIWQFYLVTLVTLKTDGLGREGKKIILPASFVVEEKPSGAFSHLKYFWTKKFLKLHRRLTCSTYITALTYNCLMILGHRDCSVHIERECLAV